MHIADQIHAAMVKAVRDRAEDEGVVLSWESSMWTALGGLLDWWEAHLMQQAPGELPGIRLTDLDQYELIARLRESPASRGVRTLYRPPVTEGRLEITDDERSLLAGVLGMVTQTAELVEGVLGRTGR